MEREIKSKTEQLLKGALTFLRKKEYTLVFSAPRFRRVLGLIKRLLGREASASWPARLNNNQLVPPCLRI